MVCGRLPPIFTKRHFRQNRCQISRLFGTRMKISTYQSNAQMLREQQRVLHQQNLKQLERLNCQADQQQKVQEIKTHWVKVNQVDVYA